MFYCTKWNPALKNIYIYSGVGVRRLVIQAPMVWTVSQTVSVKVEVTVILWTAPVYVWQDGRYVMQYSCLNPSVLSIKKAYVGYYFLVRIRLPVQYWSLLIQNCYDILFTYSNIEFHIFHSFRAALLVYEIITKVPRFINCLKRESTVLGINWPFQRTFKTVLKHGFL